MTSEVTETKMRQLFFACKFGGYVDLRNVDIHSYDPRSGRTPLTMAIFCKQSHVVTFLLKAGASVNQADMNGRTPLGLACRHLGSHEVKQLLKSGAIVNSIDRWHVTPLMHASGRGLSEIVQILLNEGANPNMCDILSRTALMIAVMGTDVNTLVVKLLIIAGVNIHAVSNSGQTAFMIACQLGDITTVKQLITAGAINRFARTQAIELTDSAECMVVLFNVGCKPTNICRFIAMVGIFPLSAVGGF